MLAVLAIHFSDQPILPLRKQDPRVDTISGSLSKFSQIPGVSLGKTITGTDPPSKPCLIADLGIRNKHQNYSLGFIFSHLARNTVDIS